MHGLFDWRGICAVFFFLLFVYISVGDTIIEREGFGIIS
jgi:hypothetical protein